MSQWLELGNDLNIKIYFTIAEPLPGALSSFLGKANINCARLVTRETHYTI